MPIFFRKLTAISNRGLSFLFNSPRSLKEDIPFDFAATKKITKNSSIAELLISFEQLTALKLFLLLQQYLQSFLLCIFFYF